MKLPRLLKRADLKPEVELQPQQERVVEQAKKEPIRRMLIHSLGSGKTLTALGAAEAQGKPYAVIAPASLRENFRKEQKKWTTGELPSQVMSYNEVAKGKAVGAPETLIVDEAHTLRNQGTQRFKATENLARQAKQLLLLTGSPLVNRPSDLAAPLSLLSGQKISPEEFDKRYVGSRETYSNPLMRLINSPSGSESFVKNEPELKARLRGYVDWHDPKKPPVSTNEEVIPIEMGEEQQRLHDAMMGEMPTLLKWKLERDLELSDNELKNALTFLTGPRQVGLSTLPYMAKPDALKAFEGSPKLVEAHKRLMETLQSNPKAKALIFSNFIGAALRPLAAALERSGVPYGLLHGGLNDAARKKLVEDYNAGRTRVALLGPSGTEGHSFSGSTLVQLLDPHWSPIRGQQSIGRGIRYDSHLGLPPELQHVKIQRFISRLRPGLLNRLLRSVGFNRENQTHGADDLLTGIAERKKLLNQKFLDLLRRVGSKPVA
jgi:hypothetical protein